MTDKTSNDNDLTPMSYIAAFLSAFGLVSIVGGASLLMAVYYAWVLSWLWQWFAVTGLHLAPINLAVAYGLTLIMNLMIVMPLRDYQERTAEQTGYRLSVWVMTPLLSLLVGWLVHFWV